MTTRGRSVITGIAGFALGAIFTTVLTGQAPQEVDPAQPGPARPGAGIHRAPVLPQVLPSEVLAQRPEVDPDHDHRADRREGRVGGGRILQRSEHAQASPRDYSDSAFHLTRSG